MARSLTRTLPLSVALAIACGPAEPTQPGYETRSEAGDAGHERDSAPRQASVGSSFVFDSAQIDQDRSHVSLALDGHRDLTMQIDSAQIRLESDGTVLMLRDLQLAMRPASRSEAPVLHSLDLVLISPVAGNVIDAHPDTADALFLAPLRTRFVSQHAPAAPIVELGGCLGHLILSAETTPAGAEVRVSGHCEGAVVGPQGAEPGSLALDLTLHGPLTPPKAP